MKNTLRFIFIVLLVLAALVVLLFVRAAMTPAVPKDYTETVKTGGDIERIYLNNGNSRTEFFQQKTDEDFKKYEIWYPKQLHESDSTFPVIVTLNGTGVRASKYRTQFEHFASWGFIVIGTEEEESWDAVAAESSLSFLLAQNDDPESIFYHKVDTDNIGAVGHSQGGAGVFNAVSETEHSSMYKTAVSVSPTNEEQTASLGWHYDLTQIDIPILLLAGTKGDFEMQFVIPEEAMIAMYEKISAPKVMARKLDMEHGEMLYSADGYITAWFMWQLQGDEEAGKAFAGGHPEILQNELYRDQRTDLELN